jgi:hypothetical protein
MSNTNFPTAIDSQPYDPQTTDTLASASHHVLHGFANDAIIALENKIGYGAAANSPVTGSMLMGVGTGQSEWLTTLTSFSITTSFLDANNKTWIGQTAVGSAVNYVNIANAATTGTPVISAAGLDTNIDLNLVPKGSGKVRDNGSSILDFRASFNNFVANGCVWSTGLGLAGSATAGTVWINGVEYSVPSVSAHTFGASNDTYVDYTAGSGLVYTAVSNNAASPTLAANSVRLAIIVAGASALSSINQGQFNVTAPVASSVIYSVSDSLGNIIYPINPNPGLIGYAQITANITTQSTTAIQAPGLSTTVSVPNSVTNLIITCDGGNFTVGSGAKNIYLSLWRGAVGSGIQIGGTQVTQLTANYSVSMSIHGVDRPPAGANTYNVGYATDSGPVTLTWAASAGAEASLAVVRC